MDRAYGAAQKAVRLDPNSDRTHFALARAYFMRGETTAALAAGERTLKINPNSAIRQIGYGEHLALSGKWEQGIEIMEKAFVRPEFHPGLGYLMLFFDRYKKENYEEAIKIVHRMAQPHLWLTHMCLAAAHAESGNPKEAESALAKLIDLRPHFEKEARSDIGRNFYLDEIVEELMTGLRKAGLDV